MRVRFPLIALCTVLLFFCSGCHNRNFDGQCDLFIQNHSSCDITIYVDNWEAAHVPRDSTKTVDDIGDGRHVIEAKDQNGHLIEQRNIDLDEGEDYYWRIDGC